MFENWLDRDTSQYVSNAGSPFEETFELAYAENGMPYLKKKGKINTYEMIQSHKESCDINAILGRFAITGDESLINVTPGMFGDFADVPTSFGELQRRVLESENIFNGLPLEDREHFGHSASQFFASIGTEKFDEWYNSKVAAQTAAESEVADVQE